MKKLKQIEFNEELIGKVGIVINFRKPDATPPEIFISKMLKSLGNNCYITAIDESGYMWSLHKNGRFMDEFVDTPTDERDLLMYQEVESRVFYVNEYEEGLGLICHTKEEAISANLKSVYRGVYIRTIKLVEEIE